MKEWITGRNPVYEALTAGRRYFFTLQLAKGVEEKGRLLEIIQLAKKLKIQLQVVNRQQLDSLGENHQGCALEASAYSYSYLDDILLLAAQRKQKPFLLLLDIIQNPQNLGALVRTAEAVGVHGIIMPERRAVGVTPAVVHASAGATEHMLIAQMNLAQAITELKAADVWVAGLEGGQGSQLADQVPLDGALALVVGSEGEGLRRLTRDSCDYLLRLPMQGRVESLNAAVAGSVVLYMAYFARNK